MKKNFLINNLNNKQKKAVTSTNNRILVLAGAGSGKTRVLTHRIAWLKLIQKYPLSSIMAITFTNKASKEMKNRIKTLMNNNHTGIWIGTFHSLAYWMLKKHYMYINLPENFQIINDNDQTKLLFQLIKNLKLDTTKWTPNQFKKYINNKKNLNILPNNIMQISKNTSETIYLHIFNLYQNICNKAGLLDFNDLLHRAYELLLNNSCISSLYRKRFINILVDEFQDTNIAQYNFLTLLSGKKSNLMLVGDDDQLIYSWRGAQNDNLHKFVYDNPRTQIICLEQNYRSTNNILTTANTLISHNINRINKTLWSTKDNGPIISIYHALNELDEAHFVAQNIISWQNEGQLLKDCAVLYRNNIQSNIIEEVLLQKKIPYHIISNIKSLEKKEIKNIIAYLRFITNKNDDISYETIINIPHRGIGKKTISIIRDIACTNKLTLWQASYIALNNKILKKQNSMALTKFIKLINFLSQKIKKLSLNNQIKFIIENSGLQNISKKETQKQYNKKINSFNQILALSKNHIFLHENSQNNSSIHEFISYYTLSSDVILSTQYHDYVQLMTIHNSKGLEFSQVFIIGMEEGLFPNSMSLLQKNNLEEERRLAYVAITRAKHKLIISYAKNRNLYGKNFSCKPSRFIHELPEECIKNINLNY